MITLELTLEEVQRILTGLAELPAKVSFDTIIKIQTQTTEQRKEKGAE